MKKLILKCFLSPGDITVLTAAVRDLHASYPNQFITDVRTSCPELWIDNPFITPISDADEEAHIIDCHYPLIQSSNTLPFHFIHGFIQHLSQVLDIEINPSLFKGDVYLKAEEKQWASQVHEIVGLDLPYWIIVSGGKSDYTIKWWDPSRYQTVVNYFRGRICFVQVGQSNHHHFPLHNVIDLRGKTDLRQLVRLVYHSQGVLCPVTSLMHLAAAIEVKGGSPKNRPCVVIAGGREPPQWEAYPHHQFIHTNGSLKCCAEGGCWKSRTRPLRDGDAKDQPENLCLDVVGLLPRCMDMITAQQVIERVELYFQGGAVTYMNSPQTKAVDHAIDRGCITSWNQHELESDAYKLKVNGFIKEIPAYPNRFYGRGIVICAGGLTYFTNAWVCINMLRHLGCSLPIQLWYIGRTEIDQEMELLVKSLDVGCVDVLKISRDYPIRQLNGWNVKPYAIFNSSFKEVLYLDADNVPVLNPEYLFEVPEYKESGAVFWPDLKKFSPTHPIWGIFGVDYQDEAEFESGQILINKELAWRPMSLAMWYNENSDYYYQHIYGDKDTYHMAFRKLDASYTMIRTASVKLAGALCQHDLNGELIFLHRNLDKWSWTIPPRIIEGFLFHETCCKFIKSLHKMWDGKIGENTFRQQTEEEKALLNEILHQRYKILLPDFSQHQISFSADGEIDSPRRDVRWSWEIEFREGKGHLGILAKDKLMCDMIKDENGDWTSSSGELIKLTPIRKSVKATFCLRASICSYSSYGLHAIQIISDLARSGYEGEILPIGFDETFNPVPVSIRDRIIHNNNGKWELLLHAPNVRPSIGKKTVFFTMWETDGLPRNATSYLNQAECILVPCQWNLEQLLSHGVQKPIYRVPLGINTKIFRYFALEELNSCIFGTAGRVGHQGLRKGINQVIEAFLDAFPSKTDVRLYVKIFPDCEIAPITDPRISVIREYLSEQELAKWFRSITCFVSAARGEGWGLMQHQALAIGRPLISVKYGGVQEFFNDTMGYSVDYTVVPAEGNYAGSGSWAKPSHESLIERMRQVYQNREQAVAFGRVGAREVSKLSWQSSNSHLLEILNQVGVFG